MHENQNSEPLNVLMADFESLDAPTFISHKIWVAEKFWNFHTVLNISRPTYLMKSETWQLTTELVSKEWCDLTCNKKFVKLVIFLWKFVISRFWEDAISLVKTLVSRNFARESKFLCTFNQNFVKSTMP